MKKLLLLLVVCIGCTTPKEPIEKDRMSKSVYAITKLVYKMNYFDIQRINAKTNEDEARFQDSVIKYRLLIYNHR